MTYTVRIVYTNAWTIQAPFIWRWLALRVMIARAASATRI